MNASISDIVSSRLPISFGQSSPEPALAPGFVLAKAQRAPKKRSSGASRPGAVTGPAPASASRQGLYLNVTYASSPQPLIPNGLVRNNDAALKNTLPDNIRDAGVIVPNELFSPPVNLPRNAVILVTNASTRQKYILPVINGFDSPKLERQNQIFISRAASAKLGLSDQTHVEVEYVGIYQLADRPNVPASPPPDPRYSEQEPPEGRPRPSRPSPAQGGSCSSGASRYLTGRVCLPPDVYYQLLALSLAEGGVMYPNEAAKVVLNVFARRNTLGFPGGRTIPEIMRRSGQYESIWRFPSFKNGFDSIRTLDDAARVAAGALWGSPTASNIAQTKQWILSIMQKLKDPSYVSAIYHKMQNSPEMEVQGGNPYYFLAGHNPKTLTLATTVEGTNAVFCRFSTRPGGCDYKLMGKPTSIEIQDGGY